MRPTHIAAGAALLFCSCGKSEPPSDYKTGPAAGKSSVADVGKSSKSKTVVDSKSKRKPKPSFSPGLAVGAKAPVFELLDQDGKKQSLAELMKSGKVALVFYRSADW